MAERVPRFISEAPMRVLASTPAAIRTATDLVWHLGVQHEQLVVQRDAVATWLATHTPHPVLLAGLRQRGLARIRHQLLA